MKQPHAPINARKFFLTIIVPTLLTIGLFIVLIFRFLIPYFEQNLLTQKKGMIRELINAAVSIAGNYRLEEQAGTMTTAEARDRAIAQIKAIRYGVENKDYFWITDMHPRMIAHPYRSDLNGHDLKGFTDPKGKYLFVEMVRVVRLQGSGYVDYMWQWMDDPARIVPKISYVREFTPWGWIIGTGIYIEDIRHEIAAIKQRLVAVSLLISFLLALLLTFIVRQNLRAEVKRSEAEADLFQSREKYKALVEASTEGTWMILAGRTIFTNKKLDEILPGVESHPISDDLHEVITPDRPEDRRLITEFSRGETSFLQLETKVATGTIQPVAVLLSISKIVLSEKHGYIVILKELGRKGTRPGDTIASENPCGTLTDSLGMGYFRATTGKKGRFLALNSSAARMLGFTEPEEINHTSLFDLIADRREWKALTSQLTDQGMTKRFPLRIRSRSGAIHEVLVSARLNHDDQGGIISTEGVIEDVSEQRKRERSGEVVRSDIASLLLNFRRPSGQICREAVSCQADLAIQEAAALMARHRVNALIVKPPAGIPVGIVTDSDLRNRVIAAGIRPDVPVSRVMSAPLYSTGSQTPVSESLRLMDHFHINHLVIRSEADEILGILQRGDMERLIHTDRPGEILLTGSTITNSELSEQFQRLPHLVAMLISSGARTELITGMTTQTADEITRSLATSIEAELGPPPLPFAFVTLGSEGRSEQTLLTDQDNALIYEEPPEIQAEKVSTYFQAFGARMNRLLAQAGYALCKGEVMAGNPTWNQPLSVWKRYFTNWIHNPDPQNLLEISTFFDLRAPFGATALVIDLEEHIHQSLRNSPSFFGHLARVCLNYKIPLGLFGKIHTESSAETPNRINIKNPIRVIVNLVRLYAMANDIRRTNTLERISGLYEKGIFSRSLYQDLRFAFDFLMIRQFQSQIMAYREARQPDHFIDLDGISTIEVDTLKAIFSQISGFQNRLKHDFSIPE